jgi:hypothetical protein
VDGAGGVEGFLRGAGGQPGAQDGILVAVAQTGLAVGTVRRAIDILAKEGLVQTVPGRGTFVTR